MAFPRWPSLDRRDHPSSRKPLSPLLLLTDIDPPTVVVERDRRDDGSRVATLQRRLQAELHPSLRRSSRERARRRRRRRLSTQVTFFPPLPLFFPPSFLHRRRCRLALLARSHTTNTNTLAHTHAHAHTLDSLLIGAAEHGLPRRAGRHLHRARRRRRARRRAGLEPHRDRADERLLLCSRRIVSISATGGVDLHRKLGQGLLRVDGSLGVA